MRVDKRRTKTGIFFKIFEKFVLFLIKLRWPEKKNIYDLLLKMLERGRGRCK